MRNWNSTSPIAVKIGSENDLSLPMRNWNVNSSVSFLNAEIGIWAYLWGIETQHSALHSLLLLDDLSLPMRNWNPEAFKQRERRITRFEPTYEELKQESFGETIPSIRGFEPTYEELKPFWSWRFWNYMWWIWAYLWGIETPLNVFLQYMHIGFEPTYEELKRKKNIILIFFIIVIWAYLWGIETSRKSSNIYTNLMIWAYLWGIETINLILIPEKWTKIWAYLWGIETSRKSSNIYTNLIDLSLPMRNWNYMMYVITMLNMNRFEPTYEELKQTIFI